MKKCFILGVLVTLALGSTAASADRRGPGSRPNLPNGGSFERPDDRWENGPTYQNSQPQVVVVEDPKVAEERRKESERQREATRKKAVKSHDDPMGGFFPDESQDPKRMFTK